MSKLDAPRVRRLVDAPAEVVALDWPAITGAEYAPIYAAFVTVRKAGGGRRSVIAVSLNRSALENASSHGVDEADGGLWLDYENRVGVKP